jgi:hypothetical protein
MLSLRYGDIDPRESLRYRIAAEHHPDFLAHLKSEGRMLLGCVERAFEDYLKCWRLEHGFLRVRCSSCQAEKLAAFGCRRRGFCPKCRRARRLRG